MFTEISEQRFLSLTNEPIQYIGIYKLIWMLDETILDCEGIIVAYADRRVLVTTGAGESDEYYFVYYDVPQGCEDRKILSSFEEPISYVGMIYEDELCGMRFQMGDRPILVTICEQGYLMVGISHWDINNEWLEFDNNQLLNDMLQ